MTPRNARTRWAVPRSGARRTAAAALLAGLLLAPEAAHAHKCDRTDNDRREASRVIRDLTGEIDAMERAIIEALRLQTGQLSGYIAQSAKAVTGALDSQTKLQAQTAREVAETGSMLAHRPSRSACEAVTGLRGLAATGAAAESAHARASATETGRITGDRAVVDRPGAAAGDAARFETMTSEYCNAARAGEDSGVPGTSVSGTSVCRGDDALHSADLMAGTLFDRRTFGSEAELRAAVELSRNLAAPVVHDPPALASADTDRERRRVLLARAADARTALAADYLAQARALRAPGAALGGWAAEIARGAGRDPALPVSRYELLELLASGRFKDPGWFVGLQAMSPENLLRELVTLQAVSLMLDWQRWRNDERRGAIDAASLALAEELSKAIGTATFEGRTESRSGTIAENRVVTANTQWQAGESRSLVRERLVTPDELMTLGPDRQYVIAAPKDMPRDALHLHHARYWRRPDADYMADPNPFVVRKASAAGGGGDTPRPDWLQRLVQGAA